MPEPSTTKRVSKPKAPQVEVTLRLGFADSAKARLGGRTISLDKSKNETTITVAAGKQALQWQQPDGTWGRQSWKLQNGCRHVAFFDAQKPRTSTKCPGQK